MNTNNTATTFNQPPKPLSVAVRFAVLGLFLGLSAATVLAQGIYRIVGPDGRVTYSDQPPPAQANARAIDNSTTSNPASTNAQLPFVLRQVASRYPVTLYTSTGCVPCNNGRNLLNSRGIPYVEKTITTQQDADALQRLSGASSLPFLTIGTQQIKGYSDAEWTQFIDAAGYPKQSILPASYQRPAASPLVMVETAAPANASTGSAPRTSPTETVVPVTPPTENPAGIRF
ncbi:glutaredoxin family protein [Rhodoferax sp.]|uniref:glutaredoxin family protein n=1 Tax=Rhodoferax sp. TaxID=50421 RepID=UPI002ABA71FB|nr:glutaredoxin family protein [Rhodoferax sp.]MDZ4207043.1 glutaredoxin family protein [Rhodoferax sp.]